MLRIPGWLGAALIATVGAALIVIPARQQASSDGSYVTTIAGRGRFPLAVAGSAVPLIISDNDLTGVARAAKALGSDLESVSGAAPLVATRVPQGIRRVVLIGTLGHNEAIDRLARERRLDISGIAGRWETYLIQVVNRPSPGLDQALVIAGSDRRGTIFGIYDLSSEIGVSPWHWWADVPVRRQSELHVEPGRHSRGEPAVKYRGIFINDEAPALSGWARATFGGFNHQFYEKVFELVLRLRGNYLWPAMWGSAFADDDSISARLADEYGIVMGTSHHEPMTRAQAEWRRYGSGPWNYEENDSALRAFWRGGLRRMAKRENIVTIGMRGDGDMPMTQGSNIGLLERIVADQRKIIAEETGKPADETPQLWALYKEVQDYYDRGMRVPDDVTLLFADDNWGNIRRLPALADSARRGGFGVYYHFDYVGGPRNYKWLNTNPIARVWEQMHLAWQHGATRIWIVNVGDIKPMEYPISFFLDYAWDPRRWPAERLPDYATRWSWQQFGPEQATAIATIMTEYLKFAGRRKPELIAPETYSLTSFREAATIDAAWTQLLADAERISTALRPEYRDAFYQLVLHPIAASANLNRLYYAVARNRLYAQQGRASANMLADSARYYFERDAAITRDFHTRLAGGKWNHMMSQTHIGYTYWQEPPRNMMPRVDVIHVPDAADMGVDWEGQRPPPGPGPPPGAAEAASLSELDSFQRQSYVIELYNRGRSPFAFAARPTVPWVRITPDSGMVQSETSLTVTIDWERAPAGRHRPDAVITGADRRFVVRVPVHNPVIAHSDSLSGFVQGNGYVAMEAEHYSRALARAPSGWQRVPGLGRTLSGMMAVPVTAPSRQPGPDSPRLEYQAFLFDSGEVRVRAYLSPSLNFAARREGLRYAISFDNEPPQLVNMAADSSNAVWERAVSENIRVMTTRHRLTSAGAHVLKFWMVDPGVVLQRLSIEVGDIPASYLGPPESHRVKSAGTRR